MHPFLTHRNYLIKLANLDTMNGIAKAANDGPLRRAARAVIKSWKRRRMVASLEAMEDRLLRDIGIYRGDIKRVVYGYDAYDLSMGTVAPSNARTSLATPQLAF